MDLARYIQSTLLRSGLTAAEMTAHCQECLAYGFHGAMVPACWVPHCAELLRGSPVRLATAVDFPGGTMTTADRAAEARSLAEAGAQEIDVMINLGWFKSGHYIDVQADLAAVVRAAGPVPVKVTLELPLLTPAEREIAVGLAVAAGARWLKNASDRSVSVATPEAMRFLRSRAPESVRVEASGGIKTARQVRALIAAGAELAGTSAGVAIITGDQGGSTDPY